MGSNHKLDTLRWLTEKNRWFKRNGREQTNAREEDVNLPTNLWHNAVWYRLQEAAEEGDQTALKASEWALENIKLSSARKSLIKSVFPSEAHHKKL